MLGKTDVCIIFNKLTKHLKWPHRFQLGEDEKTTANINITEPLAGWMKAEFTSQLVALRHFSSDVFQYMYTYS